MSLPVIGAALTVETCARLRPWILERQRDVEVQDFIWPRLLDGDWRAVTDRYAALLDGYTGRLGIHGPFWSLPLDAMDPEIVAVMRRRMAQGLDICGALGATQMVIHSPFTTWDHFNLDSAPDARAELIARAVETLTPLVRRAEDQGVTLVIENIEDIDPADRVRLAQAFDSARVRVSLDTGHAHYAHGATGAPPVDYFVTVAGDMLEHVHVQDADGHADRHWPPGEGTVLWPSVFAALARLKSQPRLVLELNDETRIEQGAAWLVAQGLAE